MMLDSLAGPATIELSTHDGAGLMDFGSITPDLTDIFGGIGKWLRDTASIGATASISYALMNSLIAKWKERPLIVQHAYLIGKLHADGSQTLQLKVQIFNRTAQPILIHSLSMLDKEGPRFLHFYRRTTQAGKSMMVPGSVEGDGLQLAQRKVIEPFVPGAERFPHLEVLVDIAEVHPRRQPLKLRINLDAMPPSRLIRSKTIAVTAVSTA